MIFKDYYKILGFETNKVSIEEIKNAYRDKAKKYHPDRNVGDKEAESIFKDVNEAYNILSNSKQRRKYDLSWNRYVGSRKRKAEQTEKKTFKEMFMEIFFGKSTKKKSKLENLPKYGEDITTEINVSLEEAFFGINKKVKLRSVDGKENTFTFKVPAGVQNKDKLRIVGQGKKGKNGGKNGDLFVVINIACDKKYNLVGTDIYTEIPINVWEAALGTKKEIDLLQEKINIIVPKCTSSGDSLIIKQKGYKDGKGQRGDLHIIIKIVLPNKLSEKEEKIYKQLQDITNVASKSK